MVALSGLNAFAVNISVYWVMGKASVLTYNMVGHMKFVLTVTFGAIIFSEQITQARAMCIAAILVGVTSYSYVRMGEIEASRKRKEQLDPESKSFHNVEKI
jgi:solute carrier family 35 protein E3